MRVLRIVLMAATLVAAVAVPPPVAAQSRTYLTEEAALQRVLPGAEAVRERRVAISGQDAQAFSGELSMPILDSVYVFHEALAADHVIRRAVVLNVLGQYQPITFIVGISPYGTVESVDIMVYRESRGAEVRRGAFLRQFQEKSLGESIEVHDDIMAITGATISSRAVARGVRLALLLHERLTAEVRE